MTDASKPRDTLLHENRVLKAQLAALLEACQGMAWVKDPNGRFVAVNSVIAQAANCTKQDMAGTTDFDHWPAAQAQAFVRDDQLVMESGHLKQVEEPLDQQANHQTVWLSTRKVPVVGPDGRSLGTAGTARDITEERSTAIDRERFANELVAAQAKLIDELATPILNLWEGVLAVPLIGTIDAQRTQKLMDALLQAIRDQDARRVLLDVTGVRTVDREVASLLLRAVRASKLTGARCALVGIRPEVARSLVDADIDLGELPTYSTLAQGLAAAIEKSLPTAISR